MKRFIFGLIATICLFVAGLSLNPCWRDHRNDQRRIIESLDSVWFTNMLEKYSPTVTVTEPIRFNDVIDVVAYQELQQKRAEYDKIFLSMSPQAVSDVCNILFRTKRLITIDEIVSEYLEYKHVYDGFRDKHRKPLPKLDETISRDSLTEFTNIKTEKE